jgi:hypothetical protein
MLSSDWHSVSGLISDDTKKAQPLNQDGDSQLTIIFIESGNEKDDKVKPMP